MSPDAPDRFDRDPSRYADYLRSPLGRLRIELALANLEPLLPRPAGAALDLGAGTGELALRLAERGWRVTLVDGSPRMLRRAGDAAAERGLGDRVALRTRDLAAAGLSSEVGPSAFDLVLCHDVVEYLESPAALAREAAACLGPGGLLSLVARTRAGQVLERALRRRDLDDATRLLSAARVHDDLYGLELRMFDVDELAGLARDAGLELVAVRGIRVVADYLPEWMREDEEDLARVRELERRLGERPDLSRSARYAQVIARRPPPDAGPLDGRAGKRG